MSLLVLSALMITLASAQFPFPPHYPAYPGNYYGQHQQQHQYQNNRGILQSIQNAIIPSAFVKTTTVNSTITATATCTIKVDNPCVSNLGWGPVGPQHGRRADDEVVEQFVPSEVVVAESSAVPQTERESRQAYLHPYNFYGYPYDFPQYQPLQSTFDEPNTYEKPYFPSYKQHGQVEERQFYISTVIKTNWIGVISTTRSTPACYNSAASLFQCP